MTETKRLNIYEISLVTTEEKVWVAAETAIHAVKIYLHSISDGLSEMNEGDDVLLLPIESWDTLHVVNPDYDSKDPDDWQQVTFAEYMGKGLTPGIIAGTDFDQ